MPDQLVPFLLVVVALTVVPGPDIALGLRNSLRGGTSAMWWTGLGCCSGLLVHAAASVIGLSALLAASATAYTVVKTAGSAYLVWLGASALWKSWSSRHSTTGSGLARSCAKPQDRITRGQAFRQGLTSNLLNPKIVLLFLTLLPQFISPAEPRVRTSVLLSLAFLVVALAWWRLASLLMGGLRKVLTRQRAGLALERLTGVVLVALGLRVAFEP